MPDRIRVLFAIGSLAGGGSERQVVNILRHLDRSQFEPHLYLISRTGEFLSQVPDDVPVTAFDDHPNPGGMYLPGKIRRAQIAHFASVLINQNIEVVYDRTPHMTLIAGPACKKLNVPHLSTVVSNPTDDLSENIGRFRWLKYRILKRAYRNSSVVIANSDSLTDACRDFYGLPDDNVTILPNGFDFAKINHLATENTVAPQNLAGTFHIVAVGRLEECKGVDLLLEAVNELVNVRDRINLSVSIVGRGSCKTQLEHLAAQHCLEQVVQFVGFQPNPYPLIKSAELLCLTSRYEGMPNVLVEAMSLGVPVLSTDCPHGPRDILQGGELGILVSNLDVQSIADGIERAMKPDSAREDRTVQARESVLTRFGISPTTQALEKLLIDAARGTPQTITHAADIRSTP
ncbi:MAG: glycosyltransferase [Planctomycetota bacterium]|nr:glycosyltransferase [Planctomycetota bacterium]MDA0918683.1 glycosyltransferase [Planctomycetota bacterium]